MNKNEFLYLQQEDVIKAGALDMPFVLEEAELTLKRWAQGIVKNPTKVSMRLPDNDHEQSFFVAMPAYIGNEQDSSTHLYGAAGMKWAAESISNVSSRLPRGIDMLLVSDPNTCLPVAFMEASLITAMRTAASAALGAKYLSRKDSKTACIVGAGIVGRLLISAVTCAMPALEQIYVYDLNYETAKSVVAEKEYPGVKVEAVPSLPEATGKADVVITATSARKPFLEYGWLQKNATVVQMGPTDIKDEVLLNANKVVVDNWYQVSGFYLSPVHKLYEAGFIKQEETPELRFIVDGQVPGRESEDDFVAYCSLGLASMDIAIGYKIYENALTKGIGVTLPVWDAPKWL
ncbi:MAG: hypothetical protein IJH91_07020 [Mogibacterium sp.]|nr:hypothetical protein [Mogibacterium sp.]